MGDVRRLPLFEYWFLRNYANTRRENFLSNSEVGRRVQDSSFLSLKGLDFKKLCGLRLVLRVLSDRLPRCVLPSEGGDGYEWASP